MTERVHQHPELIYSAGTQVVSLRNVIGKSGQILQPQGAVGVVICAPCDLDHDYRVRFLDGREEMLPTADVVMLALYKEGEVAESGPSFLDHQLDDRLIYRCIIGSRAYGLDGESSDTDYRGIYLPPAAWHWSLQGVPGHLEREATQEHYWEFQRFLELALKANPNVLECLYTPLVVSTSPLGQELLQLRSIFLSRLVYQTYNGYVASQFKKMQSDLRNQGQVKWKHVMHLIRLLISGVSVLRHGFVPVRVEQHRDALLAVRRGELPWDETEKWRLSLHREFDQAFAATTLPERPDYARANAFLLKARYAALSKELP